MEMRLTRVVSQPSKNILHTRISDPGGKRVRRHYKIRVFLDKRLLPGLRIRLLSFKVYKTHEKW